MKIHPALFVLVLCSTIMFALVLCVWLGNQTPDRVLARDAVSFFGDALKVCVGAFFGSLVPASAVTATAGTPKTIEQREEISAALR